MRADSQFSSRTNAGRQAHLGEVRADAARRSATQAARLACVLVLGSLLTANAAHGAPDEPRAASSAKPGAHAPAVIPTDALNPRISPPSLNDPVIEPDASTNEATQQERTSSPRTRSATARPLGSPDGARKDRSPREGDTVSVQPDHARASESAGEQRSLSAASRSPTEPSGFSALLGNHFVRTAVSLGFVLALLMAMAIGAKKLSRKYAGASLAAAIGPGGASPAGVLEILGRYPVARGQSLVLLKIDRRILLLSHSVPTARLRVGASSGGGTFTTLSEFTDPEEVASILWRVREQSGQNDDERFGSILRASEATYSSLGRSRRGAIDPGTALDPASDPSCHPGSAMRLHAASRDGDRVELLNPSGVLRMSDDGRQWTTERQEHRDALAAPSTIGIATPTGPGIARAAQPMRSSAARLATVQPADPRDPMASLRLRLSGLQGRGVGVASGRSSSGDIGAGVAGLGGGAS